MINRRKFLYTIGAASSLLIAEKIYANPYSKFRSYVLPAQPVKIQGKVQSGGKGIGGVVVTDGLDAVVTSGDGTYTLISSGYQRFVYISLPSGYSVPVSNKGIAEFYKAISPDKNGVMNAVFELHKDNFSDNEHTFFVLADPQTLDNEDMNYLHTQTIPDLLAFIKSNSGRKMFGLSCGDIMFDNLSLYPAYIDAVSKTGIPFFQVFGNHDATNNVKSDDASVTTYEDYFGPEYYSFTMGEIHYVVLDDIFWYGGGYLGYLTDKQLHWLKKDLSFVEKGKTVVVFLHIPPYHEQHLRDKQKSTSNAEVITNRQLLYAELEGYKAYIIAGHMHVSEYLRDGNVDIHICGAACGAWWTGPICNDGTPNGYSVYTVKGSDLSWLYKSTGMGSEKQMRIYRPGSELNNSNELIANIWAYSQGWQVSLYENGMKNGSFERRNGFDPLSVKLHSGPDLPQKHKWVDPVATDHLFYWKPQSKNAKLLLEAIDPWGRIYKEEV